ncbi:hypothetical protein BJ912DRAFT_225371 [Pholiota molesta]|nr:hypothetical protein BJ912DRAFT_225371 [Pholiota molesta]
MFLNSVAIGVIQAILITRVWFLFPGEKPVQFALIFFFMISLSASAVFLSLSLHELSAFNFPVQIANKYNIVGCHAARPSAFWRVYLPFLILHTGLYAMTAYHAITNWDNWHQVNLRRRLLRDGGIFYLVVFFTVGFGSIGSFFTRIPQINIPAIFSPIILSITSIATNRIMFSLRDITANAESSLEWSPIHSVPSKAVYSEEAEMFATRKRTSSLVQDEEKGGMSGFFL